MIAYAARYGKQQVHPGGILAMPIRDLIAFNRAIESIVKEENDSGDD
jgi:hypothetical protein